MFRILESFYSKIVPQEEGFSGSTVPSAIPFILALITVIILQLVFGKYLWNNYLVRLVPAIQPVQGIIDILAISIVVRLIFC